MKKFKGIYFLDLLYNLLINKYSSLNFRDLFIYWISFIPFSIFCGCSSVIHIRLSVPDFSLFSIDGVYSLPDCWQRCFDFEVIGIAYFICWYVLYICVILWVIKYIKIFDMAFLCIINLIYFICDAKRSTFSYKC